MPPRRQSPLSHRLLRLWVVCCLALVLPMQGTAAAVFAVLGPAHLHAPAPAAAPTLTDFRRWQPSHAHPTPARAGIGHRHASAAPQRHVHDQADASVLRTADADAAARLEADDARGAVVSPAALLALIPTLPPEPPEAGPGGAPEHRRWASRPGPTRLPERPPRRS